MLSNSLETPTNSSRQGQNLSTLMKSAMLPVCHCPLVLHTTNYKLHTTCNTGIYWHAFQREYELTNVVAVHIHWRRYRIFVSMCAVTHTTARIRSPFFILIDEIISLARPYILFNFHFILVGEIKKNCDLNDCT